MIVRRRFLGVLLSCVLVPLFSSGLARAQSDLVQLTSPPGEYIGGGASYFTTERPGLDGSVNTLRIFAFGFTITFDACGDDRLEVGNYLGAVSYPRNLIIPGNLPGLTVMGNGRSCVNTSGGAFEIKELEADSMGQVTRFWATLSHGCGSSVAPLIGEVRYNSLLAPPASLPKILRVPAEYPTIQAALDNTDPLTVDTVLVAPGVYNEAVQFGAKRARLIAAEGPSLTTIVAPPGSVAVNILGAPSEALVSGFTIRDAARGVSISAGGSPTISSNFITACGEGIVYDSGTGVLLGSPVLLGNSVIGCSGRGISLAFGAWPLVERNLIQDNGTGIELWSAGTPVISNNIIRRNRGDGIAMANLSDADIIQNVINGNAGNGVTWSVPVGTRGPWLVNNTIVDNGGAGIARARYDGSAIINNIVVGNPAIWIDTLTDNNLPRIEFNDFYSPAGEAFSGSVTNLTGIAGNISIDPFFACQPEDDFNLMASSGCIDSGTLETSLLPAQDIEGRVRIQPGDMNGPALVEMGAFEFDPSTPPSACLFLYCPTNIVVIAAPGENSLAVTYPRPFATPGAELATAPESGLVFPAGDTQVSVTALYETNLLECSFEITVLTTADLGPGLNAANVNWTTDEVSGWYVQNTITRDGVAALQSGAIPDSHASRLQTAVEGPATLTFWWKVSSEADRDFLHFIVNGVTKKSISGYLDWQPETVYLDSGVQTLQWVYSKDANPASWWQDAGWLDLVSITVQSTLPTISQHPANQVRALGMGATFSVTAAGTPPLFYQWQIDEADIPGATNSVVDLANLQAKDAGSYRVRITNSAGSTNSTAATLRLAEVIAWGDNEYGASEVPAGVANVSGIGAGFHHSVALTASGSVSAWGLGSSGQTNVPPDLTNIIAISSRSGQHVLALKADGSVAAWGDNRHGQTDVPPGLTDAVGVAAGAFHSVILRSNGSVVCWGLNDSGQASVPEGLTNAVAVAAGNFHSLALDVNGNVSGWGRVPVPEGLGNVIAIAGGGLHSLALRADGTVLSFGGGRSGIVEGLRDVIAVAAGDFHSLALRADGTVAAWVESAHGGSPVFLDNVPKGLVNVVAIAAGSSHDLALVANGPPESGVPIIRPSWVDSQFSLSLSTQSGRVFAMEYKESLAESDWKLLPLHAGNGRVLTLTDATAGGVQRYYRVCRW